MNNGISEFRLRNAPPSWKVLIVGYLLALALGYAYGLANVALVVGFSKDDIALHYYGAKEPISKAKSEKSAPVGEQSLDLDSDAPPETPVTINQPSLKKLVAEGHFHLFGMTSFFFGLTVLGLFTNFREKVKIAMVGTPYLLIIVDNLSFVITRFFGPQYALLTAFAGGTLALSFAILWISILMELFHSDTIRRQERSPLRTHGKAVILLAFGLFSLTSPANAETVQELKSFLKEQLGTSPKKTKETFELSAAHKKNLGAVAEHATDSSFTFYYGKSGIDQLQVACAVVPQEGKEGPMTVAICFDDKGLVKAVRILEFQEDHGKAIKEVEWLKQFSGKKSDSKFIVGKDVDAVSGATRSSEAVSEAVRKASFAYTTFVANQLKKK